VLPLEDRHGVGATAIPLIFGVVAPRHLLAQRPARGEPLRDRGAFGGETFDQRRVFVSGHDPTERLVEVAVQFYATHAALRPLRVVTEVARAVLAAIGAAFHPETAVMFDTVLGCRVGELRLSCRSGAARREEPTRDGEGDRALCHASISAPRKAASASPRPS